MDGRRPEPAPDHDPGPNTLRHIDQSLAAVADLGLDVPSQMEIIAVVDDYVIGFVVRSQRVAEYEEELDDVTVAEWMEAAFGHLRSQIESGAFPHLHVRSRPTAPRAATTRISGAWPRARSASSAGSSCLLDGIEAKFAKPVKRRRGR